MELLYTCVNYILLFALLMFVKERVLPTALQWIRDRGDRILRVGKLVWPFGRQPPFEVGGKFIGKLGMNNQLD